MFGELVRVLIECVSGYCNSMCVFCYSQYDVGYQVQKGFIDVDKFKKFIDINNPGSLTLVVGGHGESLLHPQSNDMFEYALERGCEIQKLYTNLAMTLTDRHIDNLARCGQVVVAIGGVTADVHHKNMGTSLETLMDNLHRLIDQKHGRVNLKMVLNKNNIDQKNRLQEMADKFTHPLTVNSYPVYFTTAESDDKDKWLFYYRNIESTSYSRDDVFIERKPHTPPKITVKPKMAKCNTPRFFIPTVRYNGNTQICCRPRKQEGIVGNAFEMPIAEMIQTEKYKRAQKLGREKKYVSYCDVCS